MTSTAAPRVVRFDVVHVFGGPGDGDFPFRELIQGADGALYGTTPLGGLGGGTIFRLGLTGDFSVTANFEPRSAVGTHPYAGLLQASDGAFYGTTTAGGAYGVGTIFRLDAKALAVVRAFRVDDAIGCFPRSALRQAADGALYGVAEACGPMNGGTLVRIAPGGSVSLVHAFGLDASDGATPRGELLPMPDGSLYGTTSAGGAHGLGTLFRFTPNGRFEVLHEFRGADGADAEGGLVQAPDGSLWGTAAAGGRHGSGVVFRLDPGGALTVIHSFDGADGGVPLGQLVLARDGFFYGVTQRGGRFRLGTIYRLGRDGAFETLHSFGGGDGAHPAAALVAAADGRLFGVTPEGPGADGHGLVFALTIQ
jgi:uncharacterized repeat protein (TIGR03803 family)